jgi:hypothetical protein
MTRHTIHAMAAAAIASALAAAAPACDEHANTIILGGHDTVSAVSVSTSGQTIELRAEGDQITARIDGQPVPPDRVVHEGQTVVVLDESGKPLKEFRVLKVGDVAAWTTGAGEVAPAALNWARGAGLFPENTHSFTVAAGPPPKVMVGVTMSEPGAALEAHLKLEPGTTTMLSGVYEGLPAHAAGLGEFDIITKVDGKTPADPASIRKVLAEKNPGDTIVFTAIHAGSPPREVSVKLEAYDAKRLRESSLKGSAAHAERLAAIVAGGGGGPAQQEALESLRRIRVAPLPDGQNFTRFVQPQLQEEITRELSARLKRYSIEDARSLEERLKAIDERIAVMDELLKKLIEQQGATKP